MAGVDTSAITALLAKRNSNKGSGVHRGWKPGILPSYSLCVLDFAAALNSSIVGFCFIALLIKIVLSFANVTGGCASKQCTAMFRSMTNVLYYCLRWELPFCVRTCNLCHHNPFVLLLLHLLCFLSGLNSVAIQVDLWEAQFCSGSWTLRHLWDILALPGTPERLTQEVYFFGICLGIIDYALDKTTPKIPIYRLSSSAVVKPCGIQGTYGRGGKELVVSHDDHLQG